MIKRLLFFIALTFPVICLAGPGDTTVVQTFTFDSIVTRRAVFPFPEKGGRYEKILMYYTLKCDSLTPWDKYPCGEWDYTTYTRVYKHTGVMDSVKMTQPSFVVKGRSPKEYYYSEKPTYSYYESCMVAGKHGGMVAGRHGGMGAGKRGSVADDSYVRFEGADYIEVPGSVFEDVDTQLTVAFWLNGDVFSQPMASTIFEGLDADGKRVINLHVPYDNGVVYFDAGGYGDGLTDNIYRAASPRDYKGRWTYWVVTKNAATGEQRIYLNGQLFQQGKDLKRTMEGITTFRIGSNGKGNGKFYRGSIDDFAIWNVELDSAQVEKLYLSNPLEFTNDHPELFYDFNEDADDQLIKDKSGNQNDGKTFGTPSLISFGSLPYPDLKPLKGTVITLDSIENPKVSIVIYGDTLNPQKVTDTITAWPGWDFYYNSQGIRIDSAINGPVDTLIRRTMVYYEKPFEVIEPFEIARFITPYGKRLNLGEQGFTWIYDVTDYEPLLHGQVDLQAANTQELIDLKFLFIEGFPARDVISVQNIWPEGSYKYKDVADDVKLQATSFKLQDKTESFMLRARISGHGEYGPYACCEWAPKKHSWWLNGEKLYTWTVWRDCGMNPVYPQGGTWQFDRAGWCPGTFVDTYDFELPPQAKPGGTVNIDYSVEPYDLDNGEESGNFEMAMQLFAFSAPNYRLDLELSDILAPSDRQEFRRMNPVSLNAVIRVRNTGRDTVRSFTVIYGLKGNSASAYEWSGKLGFMQSADIILPKPSWQGMTDRSVFVAEISTVNGAADQRSSNNICESVATSPVILPSEFLIHVKTQGFGRAADNSYRIIDARGNVVNEHQVFVDTTVYNDVIKLPPGAYDFTMYDKNEDGLIRHWWLFWEDKTKVGENGELKILDSESNEIMDLGYDWAEKRTLQFFVSDPQ